MAPAIVYAIAQRQKKTKMAVRSAITLDARCCSMYSMPKRKGEFEDLSVVLTDIVASQCMPVAIDEQEG